MRRPYRGGAPSGHIGAAPRKVEDRYPGRFHGACWRGRFDRCSAQSACFLLDVGNAAFRLANYVKLRSVNPRRIYDAASVLAARPVMLQLTFHHRKCELRPSHSRMRRSAQSGHVRPIAAIVVWRAEIRHESFRPTGRSSERGVALAGSRRHDYKEDGAPTRTGIRRFEVRAETVASWECGRCS